MRGPNADKAGAVQLYATVWAATDADLFAREIARRGWLARTGAEERRVVEQARDWLRNRLGGNAPRDRETHIWGTVERGRWTGISSHGITDADFDYDEWPTILYGHRADDGTVCMDEERARTEGAKT
jgi:hypothetical protein